MSPHLQIWKWGPHMLVSILHRVTGTGMALVGTVLFVWWLAAAASGTEAYASFVDVLTYKSGHLNALGLVLGVGLTWAFFQHLANCVRHWFMDVGANFELNRNKLSSLATIAFSVTATAVYWTYILVGR